MIAIDMDATAILTMLRDGGISSGELLSDIIAHIDNHDGKINSVVVKDFERAKAAARYADTLLRTGSEDPLLGLPITVKESFDVAGLPTTWGVPDISNAARQESAVAVERLTSAGGVLLGKTNVPTFLDGLGASNPIHGRTSNPLRHDWSPGGSSAGSAAAVRAGFSYLDLGSDLSGSIRHPAAFCGVFGHSPSLGLIPARGHSLFSRSAPLDMSTPGPLARSARDLELALRILKGGDIDIPRGLDPGLAKPRHTEFTGFRVLLLPEHPLVATDPAISQTITSFGKAIEAEGASITDAAGIIPDSRGSTLNYARQLGAALSVGQDAATRQDKMAELSIYEGNVETIGGQYLVGSLRTHSEWLDDFELRRKLRWQWKKVFEEFDAVICPAAPVRHLTHVEAESQSVTVAGRETPINDLIVWATISKSADLPATVVPYLDDRRLGPIGIQIIGPFMEDLTGIRLAMLAGQAGICAGYASIAFAGE